MDVLTHRQHDICILLCCAVMHVDLVSAPPSGLEARAPSGACGWSSTSAAPRLRMWPSRWAQRPCGWRARPARGRRSCHGRARMRARPGQAVVDRGPMGRVLGGGGKTWD